MRWYSRAPGRGGGGVDGQAWLIGIEATETPNLHIDHVTGTQWGNSNGGFGPTGSIGVHLVSTGGSSDFFEQQVWLTNYSQQGGYRGVVVDSHDLQGLYASGLFLLQNFISIDREAPSEDASASFTLTNSSLDGQQDGVLLANVKQVMITNTEILNGNSNGLATKVPNDYHGIYDIGADDVMISNNVFIPACSACSSSGVAAGHKGYGIFILHHAADDGQGSVISGNSIAYGDVGISAAVDRRGDRLLGHARQRHLQPAGPPGAVPDFPRRLRMHHHGLQACPAARDGEDDGRRRAGQHHASDSADLHLRRIQQCLAALVAGKAAATGGGTSRRASPSPADTSRRQAPLPSSDRRPRREGSSQVRN